MKSKEMWKQTKKFWNKFLDIVWRDNSLKGWLISLLFIFILIKFIIFPTLSFVTGTQLPLAIVESCSMYHDGNLISNFDDWWELNQNKYKNFNITKQEFEEFIFKKGFNKGDILFVVGANPKKLEIGDVIIFNGGTNHPIIHRIVEIKEKNRKKVFSTIGDNNNRQLEVEKEIKQEQLIGKAVLKPAPYIGWAKLIFFEHVQPDNNKGFCD